MKNIIVPIDFSEQSENALKVAASLAKDHDASLYVLHMLELSPAIMSDQEKAVDSVGTRVVLDGQSCHEVSVPEADSVAVRVQRRAATGLK